MAKRTNYAPATLLVLIGLATSLGGCGGVRKELGLGRSNPDEFAVVSQAPLSLPPDYELRPPQPGLPRPQDVTPTNQAEESLFRRNATESKRVAAGDVFPGVKGAPRTAVKQSGLANQGEDRLLSLAGADRAADNIRSLVNRESSETAQTEKTVGDSIVFWRDTPPPGSIVDAAEEQKRLKDNQALNQPINKGATPTIDRKGKGTLGGLF
jgi:hypothetical protein